MLVHEEGPFGIFERMRGDSFAIGNPLVCVWCTSVWVALALLVLPQWVSRWFAISALAVILDGKISSKNPFTS